jgi:MFS family permease
VFLISVPFGLMGTLWAYVKLEDRGVRTPAEIDWFGNITFAAGLILILVGITYGLLPYGGHTMGWTSPVVMAEIFGGLAILILFGIIETRVTHPMFRLTLFRIRAFSAGNVASFLASLSRGGLMFMLIIWLQGIWLPLHGYSFSQTPLWAGIYMIPLTVGLLLAGPISGILADRYGARPFATGGLVLVALTFIALIELPVDFSYFGFAVLIFLNSVGMGMFIAPNQTGIMNSLPASQRGAGAGMAGTFNSSAQVLSIGIFFTLMILGLASTLPSALFHGLTAQGVSPTVATRVSHLPPVGSLFAAFLGYNPIATLLGPAQLSHLPHATAAYLTSHSFFPHLIAPAFSDGLTEAFSFAAAVCILGAFASLLRGGKFHYVEEDSDLPAGATGAEDRVPAQEAVAETEPLLVD